MSTNSPIQTKLYNACKNQNITSIKHILNSPTLKKQIDLYSDHSRALRLIFESYNEELIDYILTVDNVKNSSELKDIINDVFGNACFRNNMNILHFYFKNDKYNTFLDFNYRDGWFFRTSYKNNNLDVLNLLLLDVGIKYDQNVQNTINCEKSDFKDYVQTLFSKRELNKELSISLDNNNTNINKKIKI